MAVVSRATLKGYFATGSTITSAAMTDMVDSMLGLAGTTAQSINSDLTVPNLIATNVSANTAAITGTLRASAATFTGRLQQGVSAAASAAKSLGDVLVCQECTIAAAVTAQIAFLPTTSNVGAFKVKVLVGGSAAAGGIRVNVGNNVSKNFFGTISVSAPGMYEFTAVSAVRMTGVSGAILMNASAVSANTNCIGLVYYYQAT